jgi:hypothetical protein
MKQELTCCGEPLSDPTSQTFDSYIITYVSNLWPEVTSDEIDPDEALERAKRDAEIKGDVPPHHG